MRNKIFIFVIFTFSFFYLATTNAQERFSYNRATIRLIHNELGANNLKYLTGIFTGVKKRIADNYFVVTAAGFSVIKKNDNSKINNIY